MQCVERQHKYSIGSYDVEVALLAQTADETSRYDEQTDFIFFLLLSFFFSLLYNFFSSLAKGCPHPSLSLYLFIYSFFFFWGGGWGAGNLFIENNE